MPAPLLLALLPLLPQLVGMIAPLVQGAEKAVPGPGNGDTRKAIVVAGLGASIGKIAKDGVTPEEIPALVELVFQVMKESGALQETKAAETTPSNVRSVRIIGQLEFI